MTMSQKSTTAFTLVELLVVITIIAVLAALLMPALGTAKDRANTAACASNLQRAGTVFTTYLNDHNGFYPYISSECIPVPNPAYAPCSGPTATNALSACTIPSNGNWDPSCPPNPLWPGGFNMSACCANHWVYQMGSYFGAGAANFAKALRCQANPWPWPPTVAANYTALVTYRMNGAMFSLTYRGAWGSASSSGPGSPMGWSRIVNQSDIDHPSSVMLLGETAYFPIPNYWSATLLASQIAKSPAITPCYVTNYVTWTPCYCDNHFAAYNQVGGGCVVVPGGGEYAELQVTPAKSCNALVAYWHDNGMNVLKVDGHVERVDKTTLQAYSIQCMLKSVGVSASAPNNTEGGIFWSDSKGAGWYYNQYPGAPWPYNQ